MNGCLSPAGYRFRPRNFGHLEQVAFTDRLAHALFEPGQIFLGERPGQTEVVVKPGVDGRPNSQLGVRHQVQHGLGEHMRRRVTHARQAFLLWKGVEINVRFKRFGHRRAPFRRLCSMSSTVTKRHQRRKVATPELSDCSVLIVPADSATRNSLGKETRSHTAVGLWGS